MLRIFTDSRCLEHRSPPGYPELPERLSMVVEHLRQGGWPFASDGAGLLEPGALLAAISSVHEDDYVERLRAAIERGDGLIDSADNPLCAGTWTAVCAAVECALRAADWAVADKDRAAFVATRPPGHHAERSTAMGFCYFNNVAIAAEHILRNHGLERVAIVDFDVHHGNGTQHLFEDRADVLYASLHQVPFYPGTGAPSDGGRGLGLGATVNVPLAAGADDEIYHQALVEKVLPELRRFSPRFLLISAGFDAWRGDPLGGMLVSEAAFKIWGEKLAEIAADFCDGRSLSLLEGGYDIQRLGALAESYLSGLSGRPEPSTRARFDAC